jgi:hypothetical protein
MLGASGAPRRIPLPVPICAARSSKAFAAPQPDCGLTDDLQLTLDSRNRLWIFAESLEIHPGGKLLHPFQLRPQYPAAICRNP